MGRRAATSGQAPRADYATGRAEVGLKDDNRVLLRESRAGITGRAISSASLIL